MRVEAAENPKHDPIEGVSLDEARSILRSATPGGRIGLEEVIRTFDCDALRADQILRALAVAGYIEPSDVRGQLLFWTLTPNGNRLALEKKRKRIDPEKVNATVLELINRAKIINSDPDRLQRITLKLFGSALQERDDYGDVDVSITYHRRQLPVEERERIEAALRTRQSAHDRQTVMGQVMGAEQQDTREIRAALKKGLPHLSLMRDDPMELGTPFRWLVDHDINADAPRGVAETIFRPNTPSLFEQTTRELPQVSLMKARYREISPTTKVSVEGLHIGMEDAPRLEEALWSPQVTYEGDLVPNDARNDPCVRFAGFQHLCPIWKEQIGGVLMLKRALEWCDQNKVWLRDLVPMVSISRGNRCNVIRLGVVGQLIYFEVGPTVQKGSLMPINRTRVSKIDLAGAYAVARALSRMYFEARCAKLPACSATIFLPSVELERMPDFPSLARSGNLKEGGFAGLVRAELR